MTWWRTLQFFRPTNRMSRSIWRRRSLICVLPIRARSRGL
jgi:hypothetical protein